MVLYTTFIYTSLAQAKVQPYIDAAILISTYIYISIFALIFLRWFLYLSFRSSQTPRNLTNSLGATAALESCTLFPNGL